jgi:DNA-directed RNA polymerase subunit RPC12/RpoP
MFFEDEDTTYKCNWCGRKFTTPKKIVERYGFSWGPGETFYLCPYCNDTDIEEFSDCEEEEEE